MQYYIYIKYINHSLFLINHRTTRKSTPQQKYTSTKVHGQRDTLTVNTKMKAT